MALLAGGIAAATPTVPASSLPSMEPLASPCLPATPSASPDPALMPVASPNASPATSTDPGASPSASPCAAGPSASAPSTSPVAAVPQVLVGQVMRTQFGDTQVQVTIDGGRITDVIAVQLPYDRQRSAQISQIVEPMLHDEALQAQSAQIDLISGATYTSEAYAQSLQSALDQAVP
jgi:uncharacterized protein with FMN-binding domain